MTTLEVRLLGPPGVLRAGVPVDVDTRKAIALLARLVIDPGPHSRDVLAVWLWPEADQQHARAALRRTLSALVGAIGANWILTNRDTLSLRTSDELYCDFAELLDVLSQARRTGISDANALPLLEQAASLGQAGFMAGFSLRDSPAFDDWQAYQAETVQRDLAWSLERIATIRASRGEYARAIDPARRWLSLDPLHEPAHRLLMHCYVGANEHAAALAQYRECVRLLDIELGVAPLAETTALYEAIRERRVSQALTAEPVQIEETHRTQVRELPLVGRERERARLRAVYSRINLDGYVVAIDGEAGVGKTRLAADLLEHVRMGGGAILQARCYEGENDLAYGPLLEMLRAGVGTRAGAEWQSTAAPEEIAAIRLLLPQLEPRPGETGGYRSNAPGSRSRLYLACASLLQALLGDGAAPGIALFDDLQWADDATLEFLSWLIRRLEHRPFLLLMTWRSEDVPPGHLLRTVLLELERQNRAERITLVRLSRGDVTALVEAATGATTLATRLYQETEGLPFFIVEYLAVVAERQLSADQPLDMPKGVREILRARVARVGEVERQLLSSGATIGRAFDFEMLRAASGRGEEEIVLGIERLLAAGLLTESAASDGAVAYDFSHEQLRAFVYSETSLARRRLLHRRIAEALLAGTQDGPSSHAAHIANHLRLAGFDERAAEQFRLAGLHARSVYALHDAIAHFQAALALGYPDAAQLYQTIGDAQVQLGEYAAAQSSYEAALARCDGEAGNLVGRLEQRIGVLCQRRGEWQRSESHFRSAEVAFTNGESTGIARLLADWSLSAHRLGDRARAETLAQRARELAEEAADDRASAQTLNILGVLARSRGDRVEALRCLEESRALSSRTGDRDSRAAALNNLALLRAAAHEWQPAIELAEEALTDSVATADRHREAAILNNLADFYHALRQEDDAMAALTRSAAIYAEIGTIGGEMQPEIWKLVEW